MDNLSTACYDATRENVSRGRAPGSFFDFIERFFFHARDASPFRLRVPDFSALAL